MKTISINVYQKHAVKGSCICVIATSHVKYVWYARELRFMTTKFSRARATEGKNWFFSNRTLLLCSNVAKFSLLCIDTRYLSFFRESQKKKINWDKNKRGECGSVRLSGENAEGCRSIDARLLFSKTSLDAGETGLLYWRRELGPFSVFMRFVGHIHQISRNGWPVDRLKTKEHLDFLILSTWTEALFYSGTTSATQNILRSPLHYPVTGAHDGLLPVIIDMPRIECIHENHTCYYHFRSNRKTSWMTN